QLRRPGGDGLHGGCEPIRRRVREGGPKALDSVRVRPSETDEGSETGRRTTRVEVGDGRNEDPSAPSALCRERVRRRKVTCTPDDLQDRGATEDAGHGPHRDVG